MSCYVETVCPHACILRTKTTAAQNEGGLTYHRVRGLYLRVVVFAATVVRRRSCLMI